MVDNRFFTDYEYRLVLAAFGRETQICSKIDLEDPDGENLTLLIKTAEKKIKKLQNSGLTAEQLISELKSIRIASDTIWDEFQKVLTAHGLYDELPEILPEYGDEQIATINNLIKKLEGTK